MTARRLVSFANEASVVALTAAVTVGLSRLFLDNGYQLELLLAVVSAHVLSIVVRHAGFGMVVSLAISGVTLLIVGNVLFYPETAGSFLPTRTTVDLLRTDLGDAWTIFQTQKAPVEPLRGFIIVLTAALWCVAFTADWAAFRLRSALEAIAPSTAVFVVTALLGSEADQVRHAVLFTAAVALVLLTVRVDRQAREEIWVASGLDHGVSASMRVGTAVAAFALVFGALAGPAVPNAEQQILDPSEWDNGPGTRRVPSPLVEVSASLIEQSEFELFSVRVDDPTVEQPYWRLMALTDFNGRQFSVSSNFRDIDGAVETTTNPKVATRPVRQEITTLSLGGIYLPAAYEITDMVDSGGITLEYEVDTGALVVQRESEADAAAGFTYVIDSAVPLFDPADLPADATDGLDDDFVAAHTSLPAPCEEDEPENTQCWSGRVGQQAEEVTAGLSTDYERALALQDFFLDPNEFTYDLEVSLAHNVRHLEDFLTIRRGYCQQFASAFAAMARSLGIPARLAVGFTWGEYDAARDEFVVRGEHGHAWPELYFAGVGWIAFDPTPGRSPATGQAITGRAPEQLAENSTDDNSVLVAPPTVPAPRPGQGDPRTGGTFADLLPDEADSDSTGGAESADNDSGSWLRSGVLLRALIVAGAVMAMLLVVPVARSLRRKRRLSRVAADPRGRAELAWDDATGSLRLIGVNHRPSETPVEFAGRVAGGALDVGPVRELATQVTVLRYSRPSDPVVHASAAQQASSLIVDQCRTHAGRRRVAFDHLDPRNLSRN